MMKKVRSPIISIIFSIILLPLLFNACSNDSVEWFGNFDEDITVDTSSLYRFYYSNEEDATYISKYYRIGSNLASSDLPYEAAATLRPGYHVSGFKFLRNSSTLETEIPESISLDENDCISSITVTSYAYDFYSNWIPNTDTKYTVRHFKQNPRLRHCPAGVSDEPDGDDSDPTVGPMDAYGNLQPASADSLDTLFISTRVSYADTIHIYQHVVVTGTGIMDVSAPVTFHGGAKLFIRDGGKVYSSDAMTNVDLRMDSGGYYTLDYDLNMEHRGKVRKAPGRDFVVPPGGKFELYYGKIK